MRYAVECKDKRDANSSEPWSHWDSYATREEAEAGVKDCWGNYGHGRCDPREVLEEVRIVESRD